MYPPSRGQILGLASECGSMSGLQDRLERAFAGAQADPRWAERVEELLYDGESIRETVDLAEGRVVVTSHRVLTFVPGGDGPAFRQVDRPNVLDVAAGARSNAGLLGRAVRWGVIGAILVLAGTVIDMDAIVGDVSLEVDAGSQLGVGGMLSLVQRTLALLGRLDELLQIVGALGLALAAVALGAYLFTREPTYVLTVAGEDADIHLPRDEDDERVRDRLEAAIAPEDGGVRLNSAE